MDRKHLRNAVNKSVILHKKQTTAEPVLSGTALSGVSLY
jgi:hypothetical protein